MLKEERQTWILNKLHSSGKVVVSHLAGELKVSEDTIRRDLLDLDQKGQLKRVFGGAIPLDIAFGSIATLIGAVFTYKLRNSSKWLAPVPPIVANAVLVPFVLRYGYGTNLPIPLMMLTVGAGEVVSCGIFGMVLLTALSKYKNTLFGRQASVK